MFEPKKIVLNNPRLLEFWLKKDELLKQGKEVTDQIEELENKRNKIALQIQKLKEKIIPLVKKETAPQITDEFEDLNTVDMVDGKLTVTTFSHLENWQEAFRKKKAETK